MAERIPAATLILVREQAGGPPELLMIERAATMAFAAGAMVFPGGRIDAGDHALVPADHPDPQDGAARVAAIRETIEEVGIAIGIMPAPSPAAIAAIRAGLHGGAPLGALLAEHGLALALDALRPFARWTPVLQPRRNFDTRFYVAACPPGAVAEADGGESVHAVWAGAAALLAEADAGHRRLIFPTRRNLERLAALPDLAAIHADAAAYPIAPITPRIEQDDDGEWLAIPDGLGYPVLRERLDSAMRG